MLLHLNTAFARDRSLILASGKGPGDLSPCPLPQLTVKSRSPSHLAQDQSSLFLCSGSRPLKPNCTPQTGEYPKEQESARIKTCQWIGHGIKGLVMRKEQKCWSHGGERTQHARCYPKNVDPDNPRGSTVTDTLPFNWLFPKQNAPKGLRELGKKAEFCKQVSLLQCQPQFGLFLSWEKASRAISSNTAPLGCAFVCLGDYLRQSSKLWIVQTLMGAIGPQHLWEGQDVSEADHTELTAPFCSLCLKTRVSIFGNEGMNRDRCSPL